MIQSFAGKMGQNIFDGENTRHARKLPRELHAKAQRLMDQINAAPSVEMLRKPPSNRLEKLSGDRMDFWSIRINDQWRIVFLWQGGDAHDVDIVDYH